MKNYLQKVQIYILFSILEFNKKFFKITASSKGITGTKLVLEKDGCEIDDTESLIYFSNEILQILNEDEEWYAPGMEPVKTEMAESKNDPPPLAIIESFSIRDDAVSEDDQLSKEFLYADIVNSDDENSQNDPLEYEEKFRIVDYSIDENSLLTEARNPELSASSLIPTSPIIDFSEYLSIDEMPQYIKSFCENWEINGSLNRVVHYIVTQMRLKNKQVPIPAFRAFAGQLAKKYPQLLDKDEDGNIISLVPTTLINKLVNHHNYLNRPNKRHGSYESDASFNNGPGPAKRSNPSKTTCLSSACLVKPLPSAEVKRVQKELYNLAKKSSLSSEQITRSHQLMQNAFGNQRQYLSSINKPTIDMIKNEWPFLLRREWIYKHFNETLNYDITQFSRMINQRKGKVIDYGKQLSHKECKEFFEENDDLDDDYLCILFLTVYFKESSDYLFQMFEVSLSLFIYWDFIRTI